MKVLIWGREMQKPRSADHGNDKVTDETFEARNRMMTADMADDQTLADATKEWLVRSYRYEYSYHFEWLGLPIIQYPQDMVALQEIIWRVRPDAIVETGIARGGSLIFSASLLELLGGDRVVVGIDIDIRRHNRKAVEEHPLAKRIVMLEGSSINEETVAAVRKTTAGKERILVILDSNHTHAHVLEELRLYSPMVKAGSYLVVFDTLIENMPDDFYPHRPWGKGDNAMTAVHAFLDTTDRFEIDKQIQDKLLITAAPNGYLRCLKD